MARPLIWLMKLPAAGPRQPARLDVADCGSELVWTRQIGGSILRTRQCVIGSRLIERSGLGAIAFALSVEEGALVYRQSSFRVGGLPVPTSLSPRVAAVVSAAAEGWHVLVTVKWREWIVCRYAGTMRAL